MTNTFRVAGATDYQLVADGANYARVGLQVNTVYPVSVFIGMAAPANDTEDFILMTPDRTREIVVNLAATDKVYIRTGTATGVAARGFRESRT
ncbi:hypothetical protein [Agrobacterium sp. ST15.13.015]|uniref:hypothetical protein n=1 Tax=Agrobacterium sp. ST15.13.015 TaxID=3017319 RepID=UPI0022C3E7FD|nr:hypothetical protein [Agrobacterium sp. ST15.13.015]MCZ7501283.1 hypothetical protein [Rhizobium rhizogenes]